MEINVEGCCNTLVEENRTTYHLVAILKRISVELSHC